jgi:hypothetical protein
LKLEDNIWASKKHAEACPGLDTSWILTIFDVKESSKVIVNIAIEAQGAL